MVLIALIIFPVLVRTASSACISSFNPYRLSSTVKPNFLAHLISSALATPDKIRHPSGCVIHHGDNLTGRGGIQDGDDENISVYLDKVPADRDKLVFVLNIYDCDERRQTLDKVKNLYIKLYDPDSKKTLIQYRVDGNTGRDTAMVIGMAYKKNGAWSFKAIGRSLRVSSVQTLASRCAEYL